MIETCLTDVLTDNHCIPHTGTYTPNYWKEYLFDVVEGIAVKMGRSLTQRAKSRKKGELENK